MEKRSTARTNIIQFLLNHPLTSKTELAKTLNLSMPTVLNHVNELLAEGILMEHGEYASTGGRKAKSIGLNPAYCQAMGLVITADHLEMVLVDLGFQLRQSRQIPLTFSTELSYCTATASHVQQFLTDYADEIPVLGIGVAIPGIIDQNTQTILKSHALGVENFSLHFLEQSLGLPVFFENDANAAMMAENLSTCQNMIYLSLNQTLGGAFCIGGTLFRGQNQKAGEFGHMILVPGGKRCYCGKRGCADAYCAASALTPYQNMDDPQSLAVWDDYLEHLAILVSNLRMAYDMDIMLGGDVGGIFTAHPEYLLPLSEKLMAYNGFDHDLSYLKTCTYQKEASAVGAAKHFLMEIGG